MPKATIWEAEYSLPLIRDALVKENYTVSSLTVIPHRRNVGGGVTILRNKADVVAEIFSRKPLSKPHLEQVVRVLRDQNPNVTIPWVQFRFTGLPAKPSRTQGCDLG